MQPPLLHNLVVISFIRIGVVHDGRGDLSKEDRPGDFWTVLFNKTLKRDQITSHDNTSVAGVEDIRLINT